ncbi:preprotein translocase subunit YajC [Segetibacter sp. 3557_3]|uniref:preprotein translocase subunit YajC n=1 Tax=Segetibacter sp. 3557_3 TaxID=2547429 RepID=UPI001FB6A732|nr:preprotein translocase subunit YajC [Segetibacter sp. 3557_3]
MMQYFLLMADPKGGSNPYSLLFMGGIILVFWLFMIRPQAKKAKQQKQFINDMKKGDKVVTIAGIHGTINRVNDDNTIQLEVNPGSYIKIERSAVSLEWSQALNKPVAATTTTEKK